MVTAVTIGITEWVLTHLKLHSVLDLHHLIYSSCLRRQCYYYLPFTYERTKGLEQWFKYVGVSANSSWGRGVGSSHNLRRISSQTLKFLKHIFPKSTPLKRTRVLRAVGSPFLLPPSQLFSVTLQMKDIFLNHRKRFEGAWPWDAKPPGCQIKG